MLEVYGTFPGTLGEAPAERIRLAIETFRWAEAAGLRGLLVFTDNRSVDPWAAAQFMIGHTSRLVPLVAVQPVYMHPYTAARMVSTIGSLYGRRIDLNLVTGGYQPDVGTLGSFLDHDKRYTRLVEYGRVVAGLLRGDAVNHDGAHYRLIQATLVPALGADLAPRVFVAGSSAAASAAAEALEAVRLTYPTAPDKWEAPPARHGLGVRLGIIARDTSSEAWRVANARFPENPAHEARREMFAPEFDSHWHVSLWQDAGRRCDAEGPYWLRPFRITWEFCPYLVGSHAEVADALAAYLRTGLTTLILGYPHEEEDLVQAMVAIRRAEALVYAAGAG